MSSQGQGNADHDLLTTIKESQKSFNSEVGLRFQQVIKEQYDICYEIKDLRLEVRDGFCKTEKRWADLDKRLAIQEMKQEDTVKFKDAVTVNIAKTTNQIYTDMEARATKVEERNVKMIELYIGIGTIVAGVIGFVIGYFI